MSRGESSYLGNTHAKVRRHRSQIGLDTLVVYAVNDEC